MSEREQGLRERVVQTIFDAAMDAQMRSALGTTPDAREFAGEMADRILALLAARPAAGERNRLAAEVERLRAAWEEALLEATRQHEAVEAAERDGWDRGYRAGWGAAVTVGALAPEREP
jgi:hypothetical protein